MSADVIDAGYEDALGALLNVKNINEVVLCGDAKLAQVVFEEMGEEVEGYSDVYQSSENSARRDGMGRAQTFAQSRL